MMPAKKKWDDPIVIPPHGLPTGGGPASPPNQGVQNLRDPGKLEDILGITQKRHQELSWIVEDICKVKATKAEAVVAIANEKATDVEKVFMGYILCQYLISKKFPFPVNNMILRSL
jgi:hypothetical protein